jgi:hypothetical protein
VPEQRHEAAQPPRQPAAQLQVPQLCLDSCLTAGDNPMESFVDFAEALGLAELAEERRHELLPAAKTAGVAFALVATDGLFKHRPGNPQDKLAENAGYFRLDTADKAGVLVELESILVGSLSLTYQGLTARGKGAHFPESRLKLPPAVADAPQSASPHQVTPAGQSQAIPAQNMPSKRRSTRRYH